MSFEIHAEFPVGTEIDVYSALRARLPHGTTLLDCADDGCFIFKLTQPSVDKKLRTFAGTERTGEFQSFHEALDQLGRDLMIHVANYAPERVFVHAGVVAVDGVGLMLPGTSFAGKTTLVAALVRAGATYYSDEYAVVDENGLVFPYTRDLQMRRAGGTEQVGVPVSALKGVEGSEPLRVRQVVFAQFRAGGRWRPETVSPGMAVLEMLRHSIPVQRTPARVMSTLSALMGEATACRSERGNADEVVPYLLRILKDAGAQAEAASR